MSALTIIVAATKSNGIGLNSRLPWRLPREMRYFAKVTSNAPDGKWNAVIMGRNTWESIPTKNRPLPNRVNIVTSRNEDYQLGTSSSPTPSYLHTNLASALERTKAASESVHKTFIIGGASLYLESLALTSSFVVDHILLTRVLFPDFECDAFMPNFLEEKDVNGENVWRRETHRALEAWVGFEVPEGEQEENGVKYEFQMWVR